MKYLQIGLKTMKIIEFDLNLYDQKCIEKSIEDFSDIAEEVAKKTKNRTILIINTTAYVASMIIKNIKFNIYK